MLRYSVLAMRYRRRELIYLMRIKLTVLLDLVDTSHGTLPRGITLPEKDVPILLAAIEARCTYLLTGDVRHFGPYLGKKIGGIQIALPAQYLRLRDAID